MLKSLLILFVTLISIGIHAAWYTCEYDGSRSPDKVFAGVQKVGNIKESEFRQPAPGIFAYKVAPTQGWAHWTFCTPEFTLPEIGKNAGATVELRMKVCNTANNGIRLALQTLEGNNWIALVKAENNKQIITLRNPDKDTVIELPDDYFALRFALDRSNSGCKMTVYVNGNSVPVRANWAGFGGKGEIPYFGIGGFSNQLESGEVLLDYIRFNTEKAIAPTAEAEQAAASSIPNSQEVKVPEFAALPVIDGKLNDDCYRNLPELPLKVWKKGKSNGTVPTVYAKVGCTKDYIFIAFDSRTTISPVVAKAGGRDQYIGSSDTLEIFLDPELGRSQSYQIALNNSNTLFDAFNGSSSWNGRIEHAVQTDDAGWSAELAIPLASLDQTKLAQAWGINLCYLDSVNGSLLAWQPLKNVNNEPENFGYAIMPFTGSWDAALTYLSSPEGLLRDFISNVNATGQMEKSQNQISIFQDRRRFIKRVNLKSSPELIVAMVKETARLNKAILQASVPSGISAAELRRKLVGNAPFVLTATSAEEKVSSTWLPPAKITTAAKASAARNEYETFQIAVVNGAAAISDGKAEVSDLTGPDGKLTSADREFWKVGEVKVKNPSYNNPFTVSGELIADPLFVYCGEAVTFAPYASCSFRLTVKTPSNLKSGVYRGEFTFSASGKTLKMPLELTVRNFELPDTPHLRTSFGLWNTKGIDIYHNAPKGTPKNITVHTLYLNTLLRYRLTPREWPYDFNGNDLESYGKWLEDRFNRGATTISVPYSLPPKDYLPKLQEYLKKRGWLDIAYTKSGDEPNPAQFAKLTADTLEWKKAANGIANMIAGSDGLNELGRIIDWWCPLTSHYNLKWADAERAKGKKVWWYTCNVPLWPYSNPTMLDHRGIENKVLFWQSFYYHADGILNWNTVNWRFGNPFEKTEGWPGSNGDGYLFYPGNDAPIPSLRLELCRDGMDDYDYLWILRDRLHRGGERIPQDLRRQAEKALDLSNLCGDLRNYSRRVEDYVQRREEIGDLIDKLEKY